jgi:hypothetical protein
MKSFKIKMTHTKDREKFMDEIVDIMNAFSHNKKYLIDMYSQLEDEMAKQSDRNPVPFESAAVVLIAQNNGLRYKYSKALYNFIYSEYDYIIHNNKGEPFMYDCLKHAINYVERSGLSAFQKKYTKLN